MDQWLIGIALPALAAMTFNCIKPTFHDGDNIRCGNRTFRLAAIDAPELAGSPKCQHNPKAWCDDTLAQRARDHMRLFVGVSKVRCQVVAKPDRYGRPIVRCKARGQDLGDEQLRSGMAKPWP